MGDKRNYAALDWIIGEIGETLNDARQSLEAFVEDPRDTARIRFCLTHIHQVLGSLQMVEFHGASLFAEEMEGLAEAIMEGDVVNEKEAQEALMRSLLQLPIYLEQVKTSQEDNPGAVLPLLNDLRAVRKQSYLSETNLFTPDLSSVEQPRGERHEVLKDAAKLRQIVHKLREMYQYAAASVLRGIKIDENLGYIEKVLTRLEGLTRGTKSHPLWQVAAALSEALVRDDVELSIAVRGLLRYVAREIRILEEHCPAAFDAPARDSLLRNLLYYVARAEEGGPRTRQVKRQYKLDNAILGGALPAGSGKDGNLVSPPGPEAIRSVVVALQDELNTCKHLLDSALSGQGSLSDIEQMMPYVKRIGDTLAVLGIGEMRKQMMDQHEAMAAICEAGTYSDIQLIDIAGALASIENRLEAISKGAGKVTDFANLDEREVEIDSAKEAVLNECRTGLEQVKQAIVDSMSAQWDPSNLPDAVETLHNIRGGLSMVPLDRAAKILESCSHFMQNSLIGREQMPEGELQTLAEAIASVDYYIERLVAGIGDDLDGFLALAENSLSLLGYEFEQVDRPASEPEQSSAIMSEDEAHKVDDLESTQARPAIDDETIAAYQQEHAETDGVEETEVDLSETANLYASEDYADTSEPEVSEPEASDTEELDLSLTDESPAQELTDETETPDLTAEPADEVEESIDLAAPSEPEAEPETQSVELAESGVEEDAAADEEESIIDDEIIEIFVEEAAEVQETLAEYFPQWCDNLADQDALTTVRRAFHTLKGSGRMVEALDVGELAWAIESMLNRVIDESITAGEPHKEIIRRVMKIIPDLVKAFESRTKNPHKELQKQYIQWANQLAKGDVPAALATGSDAAEIDETPAAIDSEEPQVEAETALSEPEQVEEDNEDQVLWDIFISEAEAHLSVVEGYLVDMDNAAPIYSPPSDATQRALHTLKGSAHMAGVTPIAQLIAPLEVFVKELRSYQLRVDDDIIQLIRDAHTYTREALDCIVNKKTVEIPKLDQFLARVEELTELYITPLVHMQDGHGEHGRKVDPRMLAVIMAEEMRLLLDAEDILQQWREEQEPNTEQMAEMKAELQALSAAASKANLPALNELTECLAEVYQGIQVNHIPLNSDTYAALGAAHENLLDMVDQVAASQDVQPTKPDVMAALQSLLDIEAALSAAQLTDIAANGDDESELGEALGLDDADYDVQSDDLSEALSLVADADAVDSSSEESDGMAFAEGEIVQLDEEAPPSVADEEETTYISFDDNESLEQAVESLGVEDADWIDGEAIAVDDEDPEQTAEETAEAEEVILDGEEPTDDEAEEDESSVQEADEIVVLDEDDPETEDAQEHVIEAEDLPEASAAEDDELVFEDEEFDSPETADEVEQEVDLIEAEAEVEGEPDYVVASGDTLDVAGMSLAEIAHVDEEDFDPDILEIFLEEASELVEELDESIHDWESAPERVEIADNMKRALHTLKGGARLSGLMNLGELTHQFESFLIQNGSPSSTANFFPVLLGYQDRIHTGVKAVKARLEGSPMPEENSAPALQEALESSSEIKQPSSGADEDQKAKATEGESAPPNELEQLAANGQVVPFTRKPVVTPEIDEDGDFVTAHTKPAPTQSSQVQKRQGSQEMIKVSADLLEELVNLAGETSISRGRLQQQVSDLSGAVDEVDGTLKRLNEQLRRLDIETEAQVLFRQEQMAAHEGFDPLEMDRYSHLQQLTRSLTESASDLLDLKSTLTDKIRDTETMLLQQSRINSALQEGLMRSRMVPFSRLVPRLRRIVRQVAGELGKHVNFELDNVEGEMDRSVLERMVAPLEHMLRNAVDHGIEIPDVRVKSGKPETGRILLSLAREGGDILLRLADDGRGINLDRVKEKAIERGLMTSDADLSDHAVMQFILQAGFSTAENVTQISGRGVGMDVVAAEIKQLGGSIVIDSKAGVGSQFTVRLPFTVSVNRALMVQLNNETYAIPLNTIEGIVRVSPFELEHYYSHPDARFEYAGENYQVRHLGSILNGAPKPKLDGHVLPMPVILVRSAQSTMALQVDGLMGSREIVVKSLGPQFAAVQGLSGATVMGDGSVVVIIDPHALVRREVALALSEGKAAGSLTKPETPIKEDHDRVRTIMVVDDSVTVRKVTSRFLEREGFNVTTAKDGVDALQLLQDEIPDLMLLDIEMPRMDGFEVAKNIRSTSRLKHLPIIMITSRTGDKHRQHALSIGVNEYMGKPYQEEQLLRTMESLLYNRENKQA